MGYALLGFALAKEASFDSSAYRVVILLVYSNRANDNLDKPSAVYPPEVSNRTRNAGSGI